MNLPLSPIRNSTWCVKEPVEIFKFFFIVKLFMAHSVYVYIYISIWIISTDATISILIDFQSNFRIEIRIYRARLREMSCFCFRTPPPPNVFFIVSKKRLWQSISKWLRGSIRMFGGTCRAHYQYYKYSLILSSYS